MKSLRIIYSVWIRVKQMCLVLQSFLQKWLVKNTLQWVLHEGKRYTTIFIVKRGNRIQNSDAVYYGLYSDPKLTHRTVFTR